MHTCHSLHLDPLRSAVYYTCASVHGNDANAAAYLLVCDIVRVLGVPLDVQHAGVFGLDTVLKTVRIECGADGLGNL